MSDVLPLVPISGTQAITVPIAVDPPNLQALKITNISPYILQIGGLPRGTDSIAPGVEMRYEAEEGRSFSRVTLTPILQVLPGGGVSEAIVTVYLQGEILPSGTWPIVLSPSAIAAAISGSVNIGNTPNINMVNPIISPGNVYPVTKFFNGGTAKGPVSGLTYQLLSLLYPTVIWVDVLDYLVTMTGVASPLQIPLTGQGYTQNAFTANTTAPSVGSNISGKLTSVSLGSIVLNGISSDTGDLTIIGLLTSPLQIYLSPSVFVNITASQATLNGVTNLGSYVNNAGGSIIRIAWTPTSVAYSSNASSPSSNVPPPLNPAVAASIISPAIMLQGGWSTFAPSTSYPVGTPIMPWLQINTP